MKIIAVLGGWLQKDPATGEWKIYEDTNDHLRAVAAQCLWKRRNSEWKVMLSGGGVRLRDASAPTIAALMKGQLLEAGFDPQFIVEEAESNTTIEQLLMLARLAESGESEAMTIVSNDWHLPRVQAMIEHISALKALRASQVELLSAEDILMKDEPKKWQEVIDKGRRTVAMGEMLDKERQGIMAVKSGTYRFRQYETNLKVLLLTSVDNRDAEELKAFLESNRENVTVVTAKITSEEVQRLAPDIIVSYGYRFILKPEVFKLPRLGTVNLHISFLPWNRGADPNFWSHVEGTPKGVSIHYINEGIDTGDVIAQREVKFDDGDTLKTSYAKLHLAIRELFASIWPAMKSGTNERRPQTEKGTFHLVKDRVVYEHLLKDRGWDTHIAALGNCGLEHAAIHPQR